MQNEKEHITISPTRSEELYRFGADGNLRLYSYDRLFYSLYGYDGGTTRTYKYSMDLSPNWLNGRFCRTPRPTVSALSHVRWIR